MEERILYEVDLIGKGKNKLFFSDLEPTNIVGFASERASIIFHLADILKQEMQEVGVLNLFENIEMPLSVVLAKIENEGIALDVDMLVKYSKELTEELVTQTTLIYELAEQEFNIASPKQLGEILFEKMVLTKKPKKTKSGQYSTSEETLIKLKDEHPIIDAILSFRASQYC